LVNSYWLPTVEARMMLTKGNAPGALGRLQALSSPLELGWAIQTETTCLDPVYTRGEAYPYLTAGQGRAAAGEFQRILDHAGIVVNCPTGALAHLGLARACALYGDTAKARTKYQDFLSLWKDADSDIPILKQAKAEYEKIR
jgi:eukaryotic-like serine/threonine-protein kinase